MILNSTYRQKYVTLQVVKDYGPLAANESRIERERWTHLQTLFWVLHVTGIIPSLEKLTT
jgi:hypothetical protein